MLRVPVQVLSLRNLPILCLLRKLKVKFNLGFQEITGLYAANSNKIKVSKTITVAHHPTRDDTKFNLNNFGFGDECVYGQREMTQLRLVQRTSSKDRSRLTF
jgi:hypothetical protein